jgi:hypothetical protein
MRPRRAAQPPAAPAGSAWSTTGAGAHRGEDPPHDGGIAIAADIVQGSVIIWPPRRHTSPVSRSRFGGLAFHDLDDVEGSHVRHDPPSPRPAQAVNRCHRPGTRARTLRAPGGQLPAMAQGGSSPLLVQSRQCGSRYHQIGLCAQRYRAAPRTRRTAVIGARRRVARGDGRQGEVDARHHVLVTMLERADDGGDVRDRSALGLTYGTPRACLFAALPARGGPRRLLRNPRRLPPPRTAASAAAAPTTGAPRR